jgi:hypothetical protein
MQERKSVRIIAITLIFSICALFSSCILGGMNGTPVESLVPQSTAKAVLEKPSLQALYPQPCFLGQEEDEEVPLRPLESRSDVRSEVVEDEEELLEEVMRFRRPRFRMNSPLRPIYNQAIEVLNAIIRNDMTELEKLHAIYDYLVYYVDYDFELYDRYQEDKSQVDGSENAFKLSGVFLDNKAVCDGISKAFALMCSIECIPNVRIVGKKDDLPHAWNKVRLDDKWYLVDATWGNFALKSSDESGGETIQEFLTHAYLLVADDESYDERRIYSGYNKYTLSQVKAEKSCDFYKTINMPVIESQLQFTAFRTAFMIGEETAVEFYSEMKVEDKQTFFRCGNNINLAIKGG